MKKKNVAQELTAAEMKLVEGLRKHPKMMARVQRIMEIARNEDGPLLTADEVEELLVQEMRQLGHTTMGEWASQVEERVSGELQDQHPKVLSRKKKR